MIRTMRATTSYLDAYTESTYAERGQQALGLINQLRAIGYMGILALAMLTEIFIA